MTGAPYGTSEKPSRTLGRVAAAMIEQHGPEHERHDFWRALADLFFWESALAEQAEHTAAVVSDQAMSDIDPKYPPTTSRAYVAAMEYDAAAQRSDRTGSSS